MIKRAARWWRSRPGRYKFALLLLTTSLAGWPISAFTFARNEPATVLALSWLAICYTSIDILMTAEVHDQQSNGGPNGSSKPLK